jgi:glycosyltransferase involved in cell wall biosynthesis
VPIKRIDRILDVASQIPDAIFLIAGDGESIKQTYPKYFQNGKLTNVKELGFSTPSDIWSMSDIAVLTSDNEAMPISPIEAALASLPVVAIDAGATSEVVLDGLTGFLCSKKPEEFVATLKTLVRDASTRSKLGEAGRKLALSRFSPESSVQRQIQGYRAAQS